MVKLGAEHQLLVDQGNAEFFGFGNVAEMNRLAIETKLPFVRRVKPRRGFS